MANTLIARISNLKQYNEFNKTILWEASNESGWANVYGLLQINDNAIFIAKDKLLIGKISKINNRQSVECSNIQEILCSNDQFLQLHEAYPEFTSRVKANFQPFIHSQQINIDQLIKDAKAKNFVNYFILPKTEYIKLQANFKVNDRIVLLNSNNQLENVMLYTATGLTNFPENIAVKLSTEGLTLDEVLEKNKGIKRKSARSNNVIRIEKLKNDIADKGFHKFNTFVSYYDGLFNKKVYGVTNSNSADLKIQLLADEKVYKISMSNIPINQEAFNYFNEKNLVIVGSKTKAIGRTLQTQGDVFAKKLKVGDYFYLCRGNINLEVIGKITSDAEECEKEDFAVEGWLQRSYEVISEAVSDGSYKGDKKWWTPNNNSTCIEIPKDEIDDANTKIFIPFFNTKFNYESDNLEPNIISTYMNKPLNQILFGPPGTGKTYNTINIALEIIGEATNGKTRQQVKDLFDSKLKEGQIVFTTFHQSMSYEDFIEGIKPQKMQESDSFLNYEVEPGIFKTLCNNAKSIKLTNNKIDWDSPKYYKMSLGGKERPDFHDWCIENNVIGLGWGGTKDLSQYSSIKNWKDYRDKFTKENPDLVEKSRFNIQSTYAFLHMREKDIVVISKGNHKIDAIGIVRGSYYWDDKNPTDFFHYRKVEWIAKNLNTSPDRFFKKQISQMAIYEFYEPDIKKEAFKEITGQNISSEHKPFVLIIDEINRGNISQIFGELITLIEEDKRLGKDEAIEVTLPYSKEKFGVPANLYIIGTMNTADRSVEALDAALRRRFSFKEMPPNPELIATEGKLKKENGFLRENNLPRILETINKRIEKLLDKDHQIGHSYFMSVTNLDELKASFQNKIIPLLQEYFYGDYGKIGLVLGNGFFEQLPEEEANIFADFGDYNPSDFSERTIYKIKDIAKMNEDDLGVAINTLLG